MKRLILTSVLFIFPLTLAAQDIPLARILVEKEGWREVAKAPVTVLCLAAQTDGSVKMYNGKLIATLDPEGKLIAKGSNADLANHQTAVAPGDLPRFYSIDKNKAIILTGAAEKTLNLKGVKDPTTICLWPDEGHLVIGESNGAYLWAARIEKDGSFGPGDRYYSLRTRPGVNMHVTAMTMDAGYLLYACTPLGIQVFDPTGRLSGVIAAPSKERMTAITIGGAKADEVFVAAGEKIYARKIQGKASYTLKKGK